MEIFDSTIKSKSTLLEHKDKSSTLNFTLNEPKDKIENLHTLLLHIHMKPYLFSSTQIKTPTHIPPLFLSSSLSFQYSYILLEGLVIWEVIVPFCYVNLNDTLNIIISPIASNKLTATQSSPLTKFIFVYVASSRSAALYTHTLTTCSVNKDIL